MPSLEEAAISVPRADAKVQVLREPFMFGDLSLLL